MPTLSEAEKHYGWDAVADKTAQAAGLPSHSGDGYSFGGGAVLVIGHFAIPIGEGAHNHALAEEIARRWNASL